MADNNLGAQLDAAMDELRPRGTKSQRKTAHRKQEVSRPIGAGVSSPTVDALWALVEAYATHRSVNVNGANPAFNEAKASLQGALRVLVAQATAQPLPQPAVQLPDRRKEDRMDPGESEEHYARREGYGEGWNECLDEISRLNAQKAHRSGTVDARDLPEPACYLLNGSAKLAETCASTYAVLVRTPDGPDERMPLFTANQLRSYREARAPAPSSLAELMAEIGWLEATAAAYACAASQAEAEFSKGKMLEQRDKVRNLLRNALSERELVTGARIKHLLEQLRERCAATAEDTIVAEFEGVDHYGEKAAERIRSIELDTALREFLTGSGRAGAHKLVPMELPQDVQHAAAIWESVGVKKTYAELWEFMLSKLPGAEVSGG